MPGSTPRLALPYPLGADPVAQGDDIISQLATKLEALNLPWQYAAGSIQVQTNALLAGAGATFLVTFPVGRFTVPPLVFCGLQVASAGSNSATTHAHAITAAQFYVTVINTHNTSAMTFPATPCGWWAVQMTAGAAPG